MSRCSDEGRYSKERTYFVQALKKLEDSDESEQFINDRCVEKIVDKVDKFCSNSFEDNNLLGYIKFVLDLCKKEGYLLPEYEKALAFPISQVIKNGRKKFMKGNKREVLRNQILENPELARYRRINRYETDREV